MSRWIFEHYDLWRALHIISVIAWMSGMMYLPRLYAYHVSAGFESEIAKTFQVMERKLLRIIINPAMVLTFAFGGILIYVDGASRLGWDFLANPWMITKIAGIVFLAGWHGFLAVSRKKLLDGTSKHSSKFWRATNELPFLAAVVIVIAAVVGIK